SSTARARTSTAASSGCATSVSASTQSKTASSRDNDLAVVVGAAFASVLIVWFIALCLSLAHRPKVDELLDDEGRVADSIDPPRIGGGYAGVGSVSLRFSRSSHVRDASRGTDTE